MPTPPKKPLPAKLPKVDKPVPAKPKTNSGQPIAKNHFSGWQFHALFVSSVVAICFCLYGNGISNGFSLDDEFVLHGDTAVQKGIKGIPHLFAKRYAWDQKGSYGYRPMVEVTYALEYIFFKDSPHPGHVINIIIYALLCIFLFYLLRKIFYNEFSDYFLLIALALFIFHPLHTEVVDSLKNRDEMMVFLFGFYCVWAWIKCIEIIRSSTNKLNKYPSGQIIKSVLLGLSGSISVVLGVLCKHDALIFIPVTGLTLFFYFMPETNKKLIAKFKVPVIAMLSIFLTLKLYTKFLLHLILPVSTYHRTFTYVENPLLGVHWYHKIPLAFSSFSFYVWKLVFPKDLVCYYGYDAFNAFPNWTDFPVIAGILMTTGYIYLLYWVNKKPLAPGNARATGTEGQNFAPVLFILLLFGGTIFPYLNLIQIGPGIVAERFMFIPSVGFVLLVTYLLFYLFKVIPAKRPFGDKTRYILGITAVVCLIFAVRVIARNPDWESHFSVYKHDVEYAPRSAKLQSLLAATWIEQAKRIEIGIQQDNSRINTLVEQAQNLSAQGPQNTDRVNSLYSQAQMLKTEVQNNTVRMDSLYKAGEDGYQKSLDIYPDYGTSWNNLGMIQYTLYKNLNKGIADFKRALKIDSGYTEALFNLGASYEAKAQKYRDSLNSIMKDSSGGKLSSDRMISYYRQNTNAYSDSSERLYLLTLKTKPNYNMAYIYLSRLYFAEEEYDKSIELNRHALENGNVSDVVYINLGNGYLVKKDTANAVQCYVSALKYYDKNYYLCQFLAKYYYKRGDLDSARIYKQMYKQAVNYQKSSKLPD